ncbi:MAG: flagellar biosynthesis anti-sigma factor FlgM [Anaerolineae bacterium]|nr:flagellar biosynthesis anti-sigma factor FlgM [Anaerolineae bacterium]
MKIDNFPNSVNGLGQTPKVNKSKGFKELFSESLQKSSLGTDKATVSESAQTMAKAMGALSETSDVRDAQIEALKAQILNGNYHIDYDELAKKLSSMTWFS